MALSRPARAAAGGRGRGISASRWKRDPENPAGTGGLRGWEWGRLSRKGSAPTPVWDNVLRQCDPGLPDLSSAGGETGRSLCRAGETFPRERATAVTLPPAARLAAARPPHLRLSCSEEDLSTLFPAQTHAPCRDVL